MIIPDMTGSELHSRAITSLTASDIYRYSVEITHRRDRTFEI